MTSTPDSSTPSTSESASAADAIKSLRFHLDHLDAKLAEQHSEAMDDDLAHDLHSARDVVHAARVALRHQLAGANCFPV